MEYVLGPVLALLLGMKFTDFKHKQAAKLHDKQHEEITALIDKKVVECNTLASQQTLKLMMPMAKSVTAINKQLGL